MTVITPMAPRKPSITIVAMSVVLAALDNSLATNPVLATARALARLLGSRVEAVHVRDAGGAPDSAPGVPLRIEGGPVVDGLVEAGHAAGVAAVVIGARGTVEHGNPLGSTALAVVAQLRCPVVVVPPACRAPSRIRRVFLSLAGARSDGLAPYWSFRPAPGAIVEVLARDLGDAGAALVAKEAQTSAADLIALGWAGTLEALRTPIVLAALTEADLPVMLIPVHDRVAVGERVPA